MGVTRFEPMVSLVVAAGLIAVVALIETDCILGRPEPKADAFVGTSQLVPVKWVVAGRTVSWQGEGDLVLTPECGDCGSEVEKENGCCTHCGRSFEWKTAVCPNCGSSGKTRCPDCAAGRTAMPRRVARSLRSTASCPTCCGAGSWECRTCGGDGILGN